MTPEEALRAGQEVGAARKLLKLSQAELAELVGVSARVITRVENGCLPPSGKPSKALPVLQRFLQCGPYAPPEDAPPPTLEPCQHPATATATVILEGCECGAVHTRGRWVGGRSRDAVLALSAARALVRHLEGLR